jgi:hypothetical protein
MRKPNTEAAPAISRRAVIAATTAAPVLGDRLISADDVVAQCAAWMALEVEIDRLARRWAQLETVLAREHGWFALSSTERRALPEASEAFEIDNTLERLSQQRERMLEYLATQKAETLHGVASKLAVAARLMQHEDHPAQPFVASAVRELADVHCRSCRASLLPSGVASGR